MIENEQMTDRLDTEMSDADLVALALRDTARVNAVFNIVVQKYAAYVVDTVQKITGCSHHDAEDAAQWAWLQFSREMKKWDSERCSLCAWITEIAKNKAYDTYRKQRHKAHPRSDIIETERGEFPHRPVEADSILRDERQSLLERRIKQLRPDQITALTLYYYEGLSQQEIAGILNIKTRSVQNLLATARRTLKELCA